MDGGIDDNQGIDSFLQAEERLETKNRFGYDLYISCDVSSNYTGGYSFPEEDRQSWPGKFSVIQYFILILLFLGLSIEGMVTQTLLPVSWALLGITGMAVLLISWISIKALRAYLRSVKNENTYLVSIFHWLPVFLKLRLSRLLQMLDSRATSAGYLAAVVFLKKYGGYPTTVCLKK